MVKITTNNAEITALNGQKISGYIKITPVEAFEYNDNEGRRKKVLNIPVIAEFINGKLIQDIYLAPTTDAEQDKENLYYIAEYNFGSNKYTEYWQIPNYGEIEITDIPQVIIQDNIIVHKCHIPKPEYIPLEILSLLDIPRNTKESQLIKDIARITSINIIETPDEFIYGEYNNLVSWNRMTLERNIINSNYVHELILAENGVVYAVAPFAKKIIKYDVQTKQVSEIDLSAYSGSPWGIVEVPGRKIYVGLYPDLVLKIDMTTEIIEKIISIGGVSRMCYYNGYIYAPMEGNGKIAKIRVIDDTIEKEMTYDDGIPIIRTYGDKIYLNSSGRIYTIDETDQIKLIAEIR